MEIVGAVRPCQPKVFVSLTNDVVLWSKVSHSAPRYPPLPLQRRGRRGLSCWIFVNRRREYRGGLMKKFDDGI
ncbi:hypothetical protein FJZ31_07665 [Candidatus Poribacteria bacterium]|nr:hypothetical protein [Candidatus Poribacteria bacterium]